MFCSFVDSFTELEDVLCNWSNALNFPLQQLFWSLGKCSAAHTIYPVSIYSFVVPNKIKMKMMLTALDRTFIFFDSSWNGEISWVFFLLRYILSLWEIMLLTNIFLPHLKTRTFKTEADVLQNMVSMALSTPHTGTSWLGCVWGRRAERIPISQHFILSSSATKCAGFKRSFKIHHLQVCCGGWNCLSGLMRQETRKECSNIFLRIRF